MSNSTFKEDVVIRSYEVDGSGAVSLPQIANYFQEAAGKHAHSLQFDISDLQKKGLTWVLFRMNIRVFDFPKRWDRVQIQTWPSSGDGIRAFRDYKLTSKKGETLAVGVSQWMVLDIKTRRPVRMPKEVVEMGLSVDKHLLEVSKSPFAEINEPDYKSSIQIGQHELDMNNHANNVAYMNWMTGYLPAPLGDQKKCVALELQYHKEAEARQKIELLTKEISKTELLHEIRDKNSRELLSNGISRWW